MKNPLAICSLLFVVGVFTGITLNISNMILAMIFVVSLIATRLMLSRKDKEVLIYCLIIVIVFGLGILRGHYAKQSGVAKIYEFFGEQADIYGEVVAISNGSRKSIDVKTYNISIDGISKKVDTRLRVFLLDDYKYNIRDVVKISGKIDKFEEMRFWGDMSERYYYAEKGIVGKIYADRSHVAVVGNNPVNLDIIRFCHLAREGISNRIDSLLPNQNGALLKGLLIGNNEDIDRANKINMQISGISHITAVSGLHVVIYLMIFNMFVFRLSKNRAFITFILIFAVLFYITLIGGQPSVLRAGLMSVFSLLIINLRLRNDSLLSLIFVTFLLVLFNPFLTYSVGFLLSFFATLAIILFSDKLGGEIISIPFAVFLVISPLIAYYFNMITFASLITNIIISPVIIIVTVLGYFMCVMPFLAPIVNSLAGFVLWIADCFSKISFLTLPVASPSIYVLICYGIAVYILYQLTIDFANIKRKAFFTWCMVLVFFITFTFICSYYKNQNTYFNFISIGEANSLHIKTNKGHNILIDCGLSNNDVATYIAKKGILKIDALFITSYRSEHIGGFLNLLENCQTDNIFLPKPNDKYDKEEYNKIASAAVLLNKQCEFYEDGSFEFDGVLLDVLFYDRLAQKNTNRSAVIKITNNNKSFLLSGDIDSEYEKIIINKLGKDKLKSDVWLMSNHGNDTSNSKEFVSSVNAKYGVISTDGALANGFTNYFSGNNLFKTNITGTVTFELNKKGIVSVNTIREAWEEY